MRKPERPTLSTKPLLMSCDAGAHRTILAAIFDEIAYSRDDTSPKLVSIIYGAWRLGVNPDDKLICINYGNDLTHILSRKTRQLTLSLLSKMMFPKDHSRQKGGGFDHEHQRWPALRDNCRERHRGFLHRSDPN